MKRASIIYGLFLGLLFGFASEAIAQANFGVYEKLYYDGESTHYQLIWSGYDPAVYGETAQPGEFEFYLGDCGDGGLPSPVPVICPNSTKPGGVTTFSGDGITDRITIRGQRPQRIWSRRVSSNPSDARFRGRHAEISMCGAFGPAGWVLIGRTAISGQTWQTFLQIGFNLQNVTYAAALNDIEHFRRHGLHHPHAPMSLINWNRAEVNWNDYGAANETLTREEVFQRFYLHIEYGNQAGTGGSC